MTSNEVKNKFLEYFKSKNHEIIQSSSLVPIDDDTLLFNNAGITPLKKYFDGSEVPKNKRMVNFQKCLRTNDIESVGDGYHHTFFEMLGNFSIGDYFKKEAIEFSYDLLVNCFNLDLNKLYMTYYPSDLETRDLWLNLGIKEDHLIPVENNFWEIGEGPCGPDSEIFYDKGEKFDSNKLGVKLIKDEIDNERYIEIWNNVFSQFNAKENESRENYKELPSKNIDTGMGFERMVMVIQNKESTYDTDLFTPILNEIENISNIKYNNQKEFRIIADHIRSLVFTLNDNAVFSNEKRGYVIRRILRRASVFAKNIDINEPFLYKLVDVVVDIMKTSYPELESNKEKIKNLIFSEEILFSKTLNEGEKKLKEYVKLNKISSKEVFKLYDTYGFPFELTKEYLKEYNIEVDKKEFDEYMNVQKENSKSNSKKQSMNIQNEELLKFKEKSTFLYNEYEIETKIIKKIDNMIILEKTPFYAESGGQVSDNGYINNIKVLSVIKAPNKQHIHIVEDNDLKEQDVVIAKINKNRRINISKNHTVTHLIHKSLKELLGENVHQCGSKVDENEFRFDFNYSSEISDNKVIEIEQLANNKLKNNKVDISYKQIEEAKKLNAVMLFSEKYDDIVRVVNIGDSIELCGGTHIEDLNLIKRIAIKSIENKGANLYRISGTCDDFIEKELFYSIEPYNEEMIKLLKKAENILSEAKKINVELKFNIKIDNSKPTSYKDVVFNKNEAIMTRNKVKELEKEYVSKKEQKILSNLDVFNNEIKSCNDIEYMILKLENYDNRLLKPIIDALLEKLNNGVVFISNINDNNVNYLMKSKIEDIDCNLIVKDISIKTSGNGGGNKYFAQGGGTNISNLDIYLEEIDNIIKNVKI